MGEDGRNTYTFGETLVLLFYRNLLALGYSSNLSTQGDQI